MKYVTFKQLRIKNFLSIGSEPVIVDFKKGLNIITGINRDKEDRRNGVGKSTIADALYFGIFGSTIREIKKDFIANNITNGTTEVVIEFNVNSPRGNDDFVITRSLNPSRLHVFKNHVDKTRDSIANTNNYIEAVLSSSPEIFQNCVIMTLNDTVPFMSKGKVEKRKFIEQIFNLQVFSQMMSVLKDEYNNVKRTADIELTKHEEVKSSIDMLQRQKDNKIKEKENKTATIRAKIAANGLEIDRLKVETVVDPLLEQKQKQLTSLSAAIKQTSLTLQTLRNDCTTIKSETKHLNAQIQEIGTDAEMCPTCLRPIDEHHRSHFGVKKAELQANVSIHANNIAIKHAEISKNETLLSKLNDHAERITDAINSAKLEQSKQAVKQTRIKDLTDLNQQLQDNITHIDDQNNSFDELITQSKEKLDAIKIEIENVKKVTNLLDVVKFVISEEGVKSFLIKKILQTFNSKLAFYLKKLDSNSICVFNEYFEEEIVNEKGKLCSYNNFSGAERKAIDLACLFTFMDMRKIQGDVHYNVSIYDELFDSSLDEKGVDIVLEILKDRSTKYNECILIISHRKESIKSATGDVIFLEKHNGLTKRVYFVD